MGKLSAILFVPFGAETMEHKEPSFRSSVQPPNGDHKPRNSYVHTDVDQQQSVYSRGRYPCRSRGVIILPSENLFHEVHERKR